MEYITIGEIIKAQGIKGEVKIKAYTDNASRFLKLKIVYIDSIPFSIKSKRIDKSGFVYMGFLGVDDRNSAELLVGKFIQIDRINSVPMQEGTYLIADIVGCDLSDNDGVILGKITDVSQFGAADVITVEGSDGRVFRFPFLNDIVVKIDVAKKIFMVYAQKLNGVMVYEN